MKSYRVFLSLGSNLGERERYLNAAASALKTLRDTKTVWYSSVYETDAYGKTDQPRFLNAVGEIETALHPRELLDELKSIERKIGRSPGEHWGPREIDIDILVYDGLVFEDECVTVPHPELSKRKFLLVPLREIASDLVHPVSGMTVEELGAACTDHSRVMKTSFKIRI